MALLLTLGVILVSSSVFASPREQIIDALRGNDGTHVVNGRTYVVEGEKVVQILSCGLRITVLARDRRAEASPRVTLAITFAPGTDTLTLEGAALVKTLGAALSSKELEGALCFIDVYDADLALAKKRAEQIQRALLDQRASLPLEAHGKKDKKGRVEIVRLLGGDKGPAEAESFTCEGDP